MGPLLLNYQLQIYHHRGAFDGPLAIMGRSKADQCHGLLLGSFVMTGGMLVPALTGVFTVS